MTRNRWFGLGLTAAAVLILAACSGSGASTPGPTLAPSHGLAAATDVVGHGTCVVLAAAATPAETGKLKCTQVASDARLSGQVDVTFKYADLAADNLVIWGDATTTNDGGKWACKWVALRSPANLHGMDYSCQGLEGYEGLWAYYQQEGDADYAAFSGWIEYRD